VQQIKEETDIFDGYQSSKTVSKTVYSNGLSEVFTVFFLALIAIPCSCFVLLVAVKILGNFQNPAKCSELLTTRYAHELGRSENG